jgi:hypothetical protein
MLNQIVYFQIKIQIVFKMFILRKYLKINYFDIQIFIRQNHQHSSFGDFDQ